MVVPIGPSDIGTAGQAGFGVGVSLPALPAGYTYLGSTDRNAPNFGRYLNASAQPETWVPACWLRVGSTESPRYAEFGVDAVDVLPLRAYYNLPDADADGYFLHPALDVDKQVQSGFFAGASLTADQLDYVETLYTAGLQVNPLIVFSSGEQGAWYDPSDITTLFQDSAGTTPVTAAGQPVGLMLDKSGRNNHARQATATARPLYQIDSGRPYLALDGVDDFMVTTAFDWGSDQAFVATGVRKLNGAASVIAELSANINFNPGSFYHISAEGGQANYTAASRGSSSSSVNQRASATNGGNPPATNVFTATHSISGDLTAVRVDGVAGPNATGDKGAGNFGNWPLYIGARGGTSLFLKGGIYGAIFRNLNPNATTIAAIEQYLASKSGVTLP